MTRREVLSRMRRGDLPVRVGFGGYRAVFADGAKVTHDVMRRLVKDGLVEYPKATHIDAPYRLQRPPAISL